MSNFNKDDINNNIENILLIFLKLILIYNENKYELNENCISITILNYLLILF